MPTINEAKFTINGTPSTDPVTGDPGFNATASQTLTLTAEQNPSGALSLLYEVYDPNDSQSPLASKDATLLTFVGSGTASQTVANPNDSITIVTASSGVHSWIIRCTASTPTGPQTFERMVSMRTATAPAIRKPVSAETGQYEARELNDTLDDFVDVLASGLPSSITVRKNTGADVGTRPRLNFIEGTNIILTVTDDAPGTEVDITITAPGATGFWQRVATTLSPVVSGDDVQITGGATITTDSNNDLNIVPNGTGITVIGDAGATSHSLNANDDLFVSGRIEVDGQAHFDGVMTVWNGLTLRDDIGTFWGNSNDANLTYNTTQTVDTFVLGVSSDSNGFLVCQSADTGFDFSHAQQTNPTIFVHSANQDTTEWASLTHDQTDALLSSGTSLKITTASNQDITLSPGGTGDILLEGDLDLGTGGLKDNDVTTAIALGDAGNTALNTTNLTLVGGINELEARIDTGPIVNGAVIEDHAITVTSDGATVTLSLEKNGGGDLNLVFDGALTFFDATPPATVALTPGSDTSPTLNYVYIPKSTNVLTVSTTAFDDTEQIVHIATVLVQSAGGVQTDGCYKCHAWTDHLVNGLDRGHVTHINEWIRKRQATWENGVALTPTVGVATFDVATSSGNVFQLHRHVFPAFDTSTGSDIFVVNDFTTPFKKVGDLTGELTDSTGTSMSGKHFSLVIWGVQSESTGDCKLMCNLPGGSYNAASQADLDANKFADFTIPDDFRGAGFLIARLVVQHAAGGGGTWSLTRNEDLRGQQPQTGAGGATVQSTIFADNVFRVFDEGDNTKELAFQVSGVTTGTTRTLTIQDVDGTIALTGDAVSIGDDLTLAFGDSADTIMEFDTGQTVDSLLFALDSTSRSVVVVEEGDRGFDFAHAAQTNPTVFVHSANQSTSEWLSLTHDQTDALLSSGTGVKITTATNQDITLLPSGTGISRTGTGSPSHTLIDQGDFFVDNNLEVDGQSFFDGVVSIWNGLTHRDDISTIWGNSNDASLTYNTTQTVDTLVLGVSADSNHAVICQAADTGFDFAHAQETDPTLFIHSANQATDEWLSATHDQTNGVISTGTGALSIGGQVTSHALASNGQLICLNLEVNGTSYHDGNIQLENNFAMYNSPGAYGAWYGRVTQQTVDVSVWTTGTVGNYHLICEDADRTTDFGHSAQTNPTVFRHSADATDVTQWVSDAHNQTDAFRGIGSGGHVTNHESPVNVADDGSFDLPDASAGFGFIMAGDGEEYAQFTWTSAAVVTLIDNSANVVNTDTDTNLCIFDNGTAVRVRNRLGAAKDIVFDYHYTTP
jgi:hypothetical protein